MANVNSVEAIIKNGEVVNSGIKTKEQEAASKTTPIVCFFSDIA